MNIKPETAQKYQKILELMATEKIDDRPIMLKEACRRAGLSQYHFFKMRKYYDLQFKVSEPDTQLRVGGVS